MKQILIIISVLSAVLSISVEVSHAMRVVTFNEVDLNNMKYTDRVCLSNEISNVDFQTENTEDSNNDGVIDFLEEKAFITQTDECQLYIGNASSRYELHNVLLWIGIDGAFQNFEMDELTINNSNGIASTDSSVVFPHGELQSLIDSVILIDMEEGIGKRSSIHDPISSCSPQSILLHSLESQDTTLRMYISAFGSIKSGFNSYTSVQSDVLWMPEIEEDVGEDTAPEPIPEEGCIWMVGVGFMILLWWTKGYQVIRLSGYQDE